MPTADPAAHPEYTASALAWQDRDGTVQTRRALIVQCPVADHTHTTDCEVHAKTTHDPEVGAAWIVTAHGPHGTDATEAAHTTARHLAPLLPPRD